MILGCSHIPLISYAMASSRYYFSTFQMSGERAIWRRGRYMCCDFASWNVFAGRNSASFHWSVLNPAIPECPPPVSTPEQPADTGGVFP